MSKESAGSAGSAGSAASAASAASAGSEKAKSLRDADGANKKRARAEVVEIGIGSPIVVEFNGRQYAALVTKCRGNGTFDIKYMSKPPTFEERVSKSRITQAVKEKASSAKAKRPRGRAPKGMVWDLSSGAWITEG